MSTTKMQAPEGFEYSVVSTEYGNATVDPSGYVSVDSRAVPALIQAGFTVLGITRTAGGRHTATSGEATANSLDIDTGLAAIDAQVIQILRSGNVTTSDADVTVVDGVITVADGSTYSVTAGDVINWIAVGTDVEA